jgi:uncharacterized oligopeptide transporter (OPT) family protein
MMIVGGLWSMFNMRRGVVKGLKRFKFLSDRNITNERTDLDMKSVHMVFCISNCCGCNIFLYHHLTGSYIVSTFTTPIMIIIAFFLVAVAALYRWVSWKFK